MKRAWSGRQTVQKERVKIYQTMRKARRRGCNEPRGQEDGEGKGEDTSMGTEVDKGQKGGEQKTMEEEYPCH